MSRVPGDESNAGEVLVISRSPAAGKSTVARALTDRLAQAVLVRGDDVIDSSGLDESATVDAVLAARSQLRLGATST